MNTSSNLLAADSGMSDSDIILFRGKPIKWTNEKGNRTTVHINAFDANDIEEKEIQNNYIEYDNKTYTRDNFLYAMYEDYKKHSFKVKFNTDDIFYLSGTQRAKLQYHILAQKYGLVQVRHEDIAELKAFCETNDSTVSRDMLSRLSWESGLQKMITFGAALDVRGVNNGVYCYTANITDDKAEYKGVSMQWETWLQAVIRALDNGRKSMREAKNAQDRAIEYNNTFEIASMNVFYQNKVYLTLTQDKHKVITNWIRKYLLSGKGELEYYGLMPNSDISFTIDFDNDIEILKQHDNTKHNQEIGYNRILQTFSRLEGDAWTTQEIISQGFNRGNIERFVKYGLIKRIKRGHYMRVYK